MEEWKATSSKYFLILKQVKLFCIRSVSCELTWHKKGVGASQWEGFLDKGGGK